jgi:nitric oxide reductase large subunit
MIEQKGPDRGTVVMVSGSASGIGVAGALTLLFIGLRLTGNIDWSWWWVLSPVWITGSLVILMLAAFTILWVIAGVADERERDRAWRERRGLPPQQQHGPAHRWRRGT